MKKEPNFIYKVIAYIFLFALLFIALLGVIKLIKFCWYL